MNHERVRTTSWQHSMLSRPLEIIGCPAWALLFARMQCLEESHYIPLAYTHLPAPGQSANQMQSTEAYSGKHDFLLCLA